MIVKNQHLEALEQYCLRDVTRHAFTLWDLRKERENTDFYLDWDGEIMGYMLIYRGATVPSVILQGTRNSVKRLLGYFQEEKAIIHMPYSYHDLWEGRHDIYRVNVMAAEPKFYFFDSEVQKIKNASLLSHLFQNPEYLVKKAITYAIIKDGFAVSSASALAYLPEVWVLGAVITKKEYRGRGLATRVVGHFMSVASQHTKKVVLWVRNDNEVAIRIYRRYGFRTVTQDAWINVDVDIVP